MTTFGITKAPVLAGVTRKRRLARSTAAGHQELFAPRPMGDYARKRQALARIRRLASTGMPLQPFAYTLFDLIHDAVPYDEASPGLAATSSEGFRWIVRDFDYERWFPHMQKYLLEAGPRSAAFVRRRCCPKTRASCYTTTRSCAQITTGRKATTSFSVVGDASWGVDPVAR
jgi:hypothetical protein